MRTLAWCAEAWRAPVWLARAGLAVRPVAGLPCVARTPGLARNSLRSLRSLRSNSARQVRCTKRAARAARCPALLGASHARASQTGARQVTSKAERAAGCLVGRSVPAEWPLQHLRDDSEERCARQWPSDDALRCWRQTERLLSVSRPWTISTRAEQRSPGGQRAQRATYFILWRALFERSERSERSELRARPLGRAAQGSPAKGRTASCVRGRETGNRRSTGAERAHLLAHEPTQIDFQAPALARSSKEH